MKRLIALVLCFSLALTLSVQVNARVNKGYINRAKSYLRKNSYKAKYDEFEIWYNTGNGYLYGKNETYNRYIYVYFANSAKKTNKIYKENLKEWGPLISEKKRQSINIKKLSKKTFRVISKYDNWWSVAVVKKDIRKKRLFYSIRWFFSKKHMKKRIKAQLKFINKLNSL